MAGDESRRVGGIGEEGREYQTAGKAEGLTRHSKSHRSNPTISTDQHNVRNGRKRRKKGTYGRTEIGICTTQLERSMGDTPSIYRHYPCQTDEERGKPL